MAEVPIITRNDASRQGGNGREKTKLRPLPLRELTAVRNRTLLLVELRRAYGQGGCQSHRG
jgi:hypothetical protein